MGRNKRVKKAYVKPCMYQEEFILSQMIAGSCDSGLRVNSSGYNCLKDYMDSYGTSGNPLIDAVYQDSIEEGVRLFSGGMGGCSPEVGENEYAGLCYQNSGMVIFAS